MSPRKPRSAFDQVSEFDRVRIMAYLDCGLSFRATDVSAPNGVMKEGYGRQNEMKLSLLTRHASVSATPRWSDSSLETPWREDAEQLCNGTMFLLRGLATAIFQQDNVRPHVTRIVQRLFINHQIELLPWLARSPDISPI
ncbi:transposable element Tcb1 transposase [Trichonephila clavipes]|nr:transposable element Tcb1 transposase [Trichonephila clavipes]